MVGREVAGSVKAILARDQADKDPKPEWESDPKAILAGDQAGKWPGSGRKVDRSRGLGPLSGPKLEVLGRSRGLSWRSWAALGAYVGGLGLLSRPVDGLGPLSGPKLAVSGHSLDLCWRPWAGLRA